MCSLYSSHTLLVFLIFSSTIFGVRAHHSASHVRSKHAGAHHNASHERPKPPAGAHHNASHERPKPRAVYAFGDSVLDTGNNNYLMTPLRCNWRPYGRDFNGGAPTGRCSDGRLPSDILAGELGVKQLLPPYLDPNLTPADLVTGVCFASGGSGYDPMSAQITHVLGLSEQLNLFREYKDKLKAIVGEYEAETIISNSHYAVMSGTDDIANTYPFRRRKYDIYQYLDLMLEGALSFVEELYGAGARNIFIFSLPPIGYMPSQRTTRGGWQRTVDENENKAANTFNSKLKSAVDKLNIKLVDGNITYVDVYEPFLNLVLHPDSYGFTVVNKGCCGTGTFEVDFACNRFTSTACQDVSQYVFWDSYHPTEKTYKILIKQLFEKYI